MKKLIFKKLNRNTLLVLSMTSIMLILVVSFSVLRIRRTLDKRKAENLQEINYQVYQLNGKVGKCLITVYEEDGIDYIKYDNMQVSCHGKKEASFDYEMEDKKTKKEDYNPYNFEVIKKNGEKKTLTIDFEIPKIQGTYSLVNGVYSNEPDTSSFEQKKTRYLYINSSGNLVPGNFLVGDKPNDWYDYNNTNEEGGQDPHWANIYCENEGLSAYYVWIPRYCYKIDSSNQTSGNERTDVKFIDVYNNYKDSSGNIITWETLESQGYQIPEAFNFIQQFGQHSIENKTICFIPGYWISKYQLSELSKYIIDYSATVNLKTINIENINLNTDKTITEYVYYLDGVEKYREQGSTSSGYTFTDIPKGEKVINVTILDANGEIIGSMTKTNEVSDPNPPDVSQFDPDTTFYVYWDENGKEHNEIPISKSAPEEWYNYSTANWANIVTRNNGMETYLTWIPRYEYMLNQVSQRTYIKFLKDTTTQTTDGYVIPEAFTFNGTELTGYWISKYQLAEGISKVNAEISAGSNSLIVGDISNSTDLTPTKIEYYLNGDKVHDGTSLTEHYAYSGLEADTQYTINIILRDAEDNFVGAVTKKINTSVDVTPDLTGFEKDNTFYVYYDEDGTEHSDIPISSPAPNNWYDYAKQNWANIVVKANGNVSYFTWIPRYEYAITDADNAKQRTEVIFVTTDITNNNCTTGYKVPKAFTFNGKELRGYWISKYQLVDK